MSPRFCSINGCEKPARRRGWCSAHHSRWRRHGSPLDGGPMQPRGRSVPERFWQKVDTSAGPEGCWVWTGAADNYGYGRIRIGGRDGSTQKAHRVSYEFINGPIPFGLEIDHRCGRPECVNPAHLRTATHAENMQNLRGAKRNSKTGVRGVSPYRDRYRATVVHHRKQIHLGAFDTVEQAEAAVRAVRRRIFTHSEMDRVAPPAEPKQLELALLGNDAQEAA